MKLDALIAFTQASYPGHEINFFFKEPSGS